MLYKSKKEQIIWEERIACVKGGRTGAQNDSVKCGREGRQELTIDKCHFKAFGLYSVVNGGTTKKLL